MASDNSRSLSPCPALDPVGSCWEETSGSVAPAVSVIIAASNPGDEWREAISSVVAQTFTDWELTVVDDGSREDFTWVSSVDPRISLVHQRNQGISTARNYIIAVSRARFIAFLDQDHRWRPTNLERQLELLNGSVFCHSAFDLIASQGSRIGLGYGENMGYWDMLAGRLGVLLGSSIIDPTVLHHIGSFDPRLRYQQDLDLFLRASRSFVPIGYVPTVEADYRLHAGNASKNYWASVRELHELNAREARLGWWRNDTTVARAISEGEHQVQRTYAFQTIDAAHLAARIQGHTSCPGHKTKCSSRPARLRRVRQETPSPLTP